MKGVVRAARISRLCLDLGRAEAISIHLRLRLRSCSGDTRLVEPALMGETVSSSCSRRLTAAWVAFVEVWQCRELPAGPLPVFLALQRNGARPAGGAPTPELSAGR